MDNKKDFLTPSRAAWLGQVKEITSPPDTTRLGAIMVSKHMVGYGKEKEAEWFMSCGETDLKRQRQ